MIVSLYWDKNALFKLLKVCSSRNATNFLLGNWFLTATTVAFNLEGECAKSLNTFEVAFSANNCNLFEAPLNVEIAL